MTPFTIGIIGIIILFLLFLIRMPVGFAMGLVGFLGLAYINGVKPGLNSMGSTPHSISSTYSMSVVPLFVFMGTLCFHAGLSKDLYYAVYRWIAPGRS